MSRCADNRVFRFIMNIKFKLHSYTRTEQESDYFSFVYKRILLKILNLRYYYNVIYSIRFLALLAMRMPLKNI